MLSHNHPSASRKPSQADITITQKLKDGCKAVGLLLLDHLIITSEGYMSFADEGLL
jgi:DNA repair protein RadC